jgi:drug/metabolite transporter (DMT)-like permease
LALIDGATDDGLVARIWLALGTVYVVWGSTYLGIMVGIRTMPPLLMMSARFLLAGAVLFLWAVHRGARPTPRGWMASAIVGAALLFVGNGGIAWAETRIDSGVAALVVAVVPIWIALLQWLVFRRSARPATIAGLVLGVVGVALLVGPGGSVDAIGALVIVIGSLSWAAGSLYAQRAPLPSDHLLTAGMQMLVGGALLGVAGGFAGEASQLQVPSWESLGAFAYLLVVGSLVTYTAYGWLLQKASATLVTTYAYVNPIVAVLLGALVLGERLTPAMALAGGAIVAAVVLIVSPAPARAARVVRLRRRLQPALERAA